MVLRKLNRSLQKIPVVQNTYLDHYGTLKRSFLRYGRKLNMVKTPIFVHWHATYECNFRCEHCAAEAGEKEQGTVTSAQILSAVEDMGHLGVQTFIVTGGEPLLRGDIFEIFHGARAAGVANVVLATNGFLVERFEKELGDAGLSAVHISIDGLPETNDRIRGVRHAWKKAWSALEFFKGVGVGERVLNTLVHKKNIHELERLAEYVYDSAATTWNLQTPMPIGRARRYDYLTMDDDDFKYLLRFARKARNHIRIQMAHHLGYLGPLDRIIRPEPFFCGAGSQTCTILPAGEVVGCQVFYDPSTAEGNIRQESFKDIWERLFKKSFKAELGEECESCRYHAACLGGCSAFRKIEGRCCLKDIWEDVCASEG